MELKSLYIEPTSHCNLQCEMCSRNFWENESVGHMDWALFEKVIRGLPDSVERIFFGGIGEPLVHPDIIRMVTAAKASGRRVEMISNGTLLDAETSKNLVGAGIDLLWISLDSLDETGYASIRRGGRFGNVISNIYGYNLARGKLTKEPEEYSKDVLPASRLGIAFVLMKKNLPQFRRLIERAEYLGIDQIKATHLIPYDRSQEQQVCYRRLFDIGLFHAPTDVHANVDFPLMEPSDLKEQDMLPLFSNSHLTFSLLGLPQTRLTDYCRFVREGHMFLRWDGTASPCMALLHDNQVYQWERTRKIRHAGFGNAADFSVTELWNGEDYAAFRRRVTDFTFSPCAACGSCDLFSTNESDCTGNPFPACGGCLWAQGLFQCP